MKTCDVAVIGGGIIGTSCALALAEEGLRVIILDRQMPGREASWAAGGMLSPAPYLSGDELLTPLASESLRLYAKFVQSIEAASQKSANHNRTGAIELFFGPEALLERDRYVALCRTLNLKVEKISATEARRLEPAVASTARAALHFPDEETVEPRALMDAALEAAHARGVTVHANCAVHSLIIENNRCVGIIAQNDRIETRHVILAAGCYSQKVFGSSSYGGERLAPFLPTRPIRGQMLALLPRDTSLTHAVRSSRGYLVPRGNGSIVAGSTLEEAGFDKRTTLEGLQKIRKAAVELLPGLASAEIVESWCGLRPGTPDDLPILGPIDVEGVILATGHFRNGILLAPITAQLVKEWVTGAVPCVPVASYSPFRFVRSSAQANSIAGA
jgi:glycine oxidase